MADGRIPLSHAGRTANPPGRPVEYLRALLIAHGALPARNEPPARLERRVAPGITDTEDRRTVNAYATWRVLHRARHHAGQRPATSTAPGAPGRPA